MNTHRPDIFRAAGLFLGAICFVFLLKFIIFIFAVLAMLITTIKSI